MANVWDAMKKNEDENRRNDDETSPSSEQAASGKTDKTADKAVEKTSRPKRVAPKAAAVSLSSTATVEIDKTRGKDYSRSLITHHDRGDTITEEYRALKTNLMARYPDERFCTLVTSAGAGEGKTVTTLNMALVLAESVDRKTLVVDFDLRRGKMANYLGVQPTPGMVDLLREKATLDEVIQPTAYPNVFFLPKGRCDSSEVGGLLGRPALDEIVPQMRKQFDFVLFDTPPINMVSDAGIIGRYTGHGLVVVRMNRTRKESVDKAIRLLHAANVELDGLILTHQKYYIPNYLYRYS